MEITIGVQNLNRELVVETDQKPEEIAEAVRAALEGGKPFEVKDTKGRQILVPAAVLGYVEIGTGEQRPVGFGSL
ncbi:MULTISPECIES: DUF3107 domain-containing protein [unclassified Isoptericola]|uniref:DUF3107 domain-containing protein n=1 Tax=unclassified Isoptericola TaxID=2623355 RepID=UPI002712F1D2|nr:MULTISPECIES: DUF3107 domain-containing protein [unclassified Isoptericola]MDO8144214.1 DUF3107 domain-containing protein [Isoptericola sp. 178]MDO8148068.1 DUF3107 domain-containing protein [Isoptericola sp. b515]MDO8151543.1 DUF3107 domain-containing protein [Isoptericola sp. b408]